MPASTRKLAVGAAGTALAVGIASCAGGSGSLPQQGPQGANAVIRLIGDGSTAYTGNQPGVPRPERLKPSQKPPQFVVFSWDGAGEDSQKLFSRFRKLGRKHGATMTYFLSGVYLLPEDKAGEYEPPRHAPGSSEIGFNDTKGIKATVRELRQAWLEGNEIGTHFNGHFCGADGGVGSWSVRDWKSEISQAKSFVKHWKTNTALTSEPPLPFDYDKELIGGRTPCLEGRENFLKAASELGFRYDASGTGEQVWPDKERGMWEFSLQMIPVPGRAFESLAMDYNFMVNQSGTSKGDPTMHRYWGDQMRNGLIQGFERAYSGNRAPMIIGNHFESWNGGAYMRAVEETVGVLCARPETRCVSFRQLADWLDAQDPKVLAKLRTLPVGQAPGQGWESFITPQPAKPVAKSAAEPATKPAEKSKHANSA
ncbi:hypothetical protein ABZ611_05580 [Streptomyces sp. NPDC007861]|uniref:hypothetical protein n=1 Tax=Streptomyces sp. NPDC007861 TaxID=3154893 RepID=UPI0033F9EA21